MKCIDGPQRIAIDQTLLITVGIISDSTDTAGGLAAADLELVAQTLHLNNVGRGGHRLITYYGTEQHWERPTTELQDEAAATTAMTGWNHAQ